MNPSLLDRLASLAPLAVLAYVLRRHETERRDYLRALESDRESFRNERRELINRVQFPARMPVATQPIRPTDRVITDATAAARDAWNGVGIAALPGLPGDGDDVPGAN